MRNPLFFVALAAVFIVSCKKEKSVEAGSGGGGGGSTSGLLTRQVTKDGSDSTIVIYGYDAQKRLISAKTTDVYTGGPDEYETKLIRNSQGIILKVVDKSADYLPIIGADSIFYAVRYDAAKARYTSKTLTLTDGTDTIKDSVAFTYNAAGRLTMQESFFDDGTTGGYEEYTKTEYTYDAAGNVSIAKTSEFDPATGTYELSYQIGYEYDNKTNPLSLGNEAFVYGEPSLSSTRNVTKVTFDDADPTAADETSTVVYVYNSGSKPSSATFQGSSSSGGISFYYQ